LITKSAVGCIQVRSWLYAWISQLEMSFKVTRMYCSFIVRILSFPNRPALVQVSRRYYPYNLFLEHKAGPYNLLNGSTQLQTITKLAVKQWRWASTASLTGLSLLANAAVWFLQVNLATNVKPRSLTAVRLSGIGVLVKLQIILI
jgi:hypothetical protein